MKNKLSTLCVIALSTMCIFLFGCGNTKNPEEAIDYLKNLKSYKCNIVIETKNNRQSLNYEGKQYYDSNNGTRLELGDDRVLIYKGNDIFVKDLKNNSQYTTDESYDKTYKLSFIKNFVDLIYSNENIKTYYKKLDEKEYEIIELEIPGDNLNIQKAALYVSAEDYLPQWMIVYDSNYREVLRFVYTDFKTNVQMDSKLFTM
ncbi:MAG: hypothetical protein K0R54_1204 [Clostridiaceae bacterium]|nr:hypothetical protein [Clostridiaceae bacterium]